MVNDVAQVLRESRDWVARGTDDHLIWATWDSVEEALEELDALMIRAKSGDVAWSEVAVLFAPTGDLQEVSMQAGWHDEFLELADRADAALGPAPE